MAKQVEIRRKTMYQDIDVATKKKQRKQKDEMKLLKAKYNEVSICYVDIYGFGCIYERPL